MTDSVCPCTYSVFAFSQQMTQRWWGSEDLDPPYVMRRHSTASDPTGFDTFTPRFVVPKGIGGVAKFEYTQSPQNPGNHARKLLGQINGCLHTQGVDHELEGED